VRAPRLGHVYVDLADVEATATVEGEEPEPADLSALPWPEAGDWLARVRASPLTGGPLQLEGAALYLDRYWREEGQIAADLTAFSDPAAVDADVLRAGLERLFRGDADTAQRLAAASAVLRRFAVVAGGPGTGKTTTVARIVALLMEQSETPPLVALAAPTGKAAARLEESVHEEAGRLDVDDAVRAQLRALSASTLHRLLGWRPGSHSRFRHHRGNRLPHDVVIVDETSMVSLSLMARLVEAVRPDARLILVGDPGQLTSIEAGAVLGDIVGPASRGLVMSADARAALASVTGGDVTAADPPAGATMGDGIVVLDRVHRFGEGIASLADAVRSGDGDAVIDVLRDRPEGVTWLSVDVADPAADAELAPVRAGAVATARAVIGAAETGAASEAIDALGGFRVLCAHRRGPHGVATWMPRIESWLDLPSEPWYVGRPLLITENDHAVRLYNGDTGVVVARPDGRPVAAFERQGEIVTFSPSRLAAVETVYAMTVHKAQGSQFKTAAVLLPDPRSPILTRELLYTAVTRAREHLLLVGTAEAITAAVERPIARASGLRDRLRKD
jgi:exodeoxyribonuclease V alpha subunit